jgi:hypothetical protein
MPWNIILRIYQFTEAEILHLAKYMDIRDIARFQNVATYHFIYSHFKDEVDESDRIDWLDIETWTANRKY